MIVIDVENAPYKIRGMLTRRLLEVRAGLFVGSLSKRATEQLWEEVIIANPTAAFLAFPAKNELGVGIISIGNHQYKVEDNFGLPLVKYHKKIGEKFKSS